MTSGYLRRVAVGWRWDGRLWLWLWASITERKFGWFLAEMQARSKAPLGSKTQVGAVGALGFAERRPPGGNAIRATALRA